MEYGNFLTEISNTSDDNSQPEEIFLFPLALYLEHKSVVSTYIRVTKKPKMKFRVEMCKSKRKLKYLNLKTRSSVTKLNLIKWGSFPWRRSFSIVLRMNNLRLLSLVFVYLLLIGDHLYGSIQIEIRLEKCRTAMHTTIEFPQVMVLFNFKK